MGRILKIWKIGSSDKSSERKFGRISEDYETGHSTESSSQSLSTIFSKRPSSNPYSSTRAFALAYASADKWGLPSGMRVFAIFRALPASPSSKRSGWSDARMYPIISGLNFHSVNTIAATSEEGSQKTSSSAKNGSSTEANAVLNSGASPFSRAILETISAQTSWRNAAKPSSDLMADILGSLQVSIMRFWCLVVFVNVSMSEPYGVKSGLT